MTHLSSKVSEGPRSRAARDELPSTLNTDLPVSSEGETYLQRIKNGEFMLDRYVPFWAAAMFDRYLLFVLPLLLIVLPLLARSPVLYDVYMRRKINRWYKEVRNLEANVESMNIYEVDAAIVELDEVDDMLAYELSISNDFMPNLYALRTHIDYVSRRLEKRKESMEEPAMKDAEMKERQSEPLSSQTMEKTEPVS